MTKFTSKIIAVKTYDESVAHLARLRQKSLVIFDVDFVIQQPKNPCFQARTLSQYSPLIKKMLHGFSPAEKDLCLHSLVFGKDLEMIDPKVLSILEVLKKRQVKTLMLTALSSGHVSGASIPEWRYNTLKKMGVSCAASFDMKKTYFTDFPFYLENYPLFYKGILFSNGQYSPHNKGQVLKAFLDEAVWTPKHVVVFDDLMENLREIEAALSTMKGVLSFTGLHYLGALSFPVTIPTKETVEKVWTDEIRASKGFQITRGS